MDSKTEIANFALSHLGSGYNITDLDTERSNEARACRRFFETARDIVLRDFGWPFATKIIALGLVEENPNDEWAFSYRMPSDYVALRRILSGIRNDTQTSKIPYKLANDDVGLLIYTDKSDAEIEYTFREERVQLYPPDFCMALSLRLAVYIAPQITAGDPFKLGPKALQTYLFELEKAQANSLNEEEPDQQPDAESIRARE